MMSIFFGKYWHSLGFCVTNLQLLVHVNTFWRTKILNFEYVLLQMGMGMTWVPLGWYGYLLVQINNGLLSLVHMYIQKVM